MNPILFLIFITFIYFDVLLFRKQDKGLVREIFQPEHWIWKYLTVMSVVILLGSGSFQDLTLFWMICPLLIYFVRRWRFKRAVKAIRGEISEIEKNHLALALDAFDILVYWFWGMVGVMFTLELLYRSLPSLESRLGDLVVLAIFSSGFMIVLIYRISQKYLHWDFRKLIALEIPFLPKWKVWGLPALGGLFFAIISSLLIFSRDIQPMTPLNDVLENTNSSLGFFAFLILAVLLAPFLEEIIFRGYFFFVLEKCRGRVWAIGLIAGIFALLHVDQYWGDWAAILMVGALGLVLTFLRARTGSTIPGIVMHYTYNGAMTVVPVIMLMFSNPSYFEYQVNHFRLDGQQKEALLQKTIHEHPDFVDAYNDLAWLYAEEKRNLDEALDLINRALEVYPGRYMFLDTKAEVLYQMGRYEEVKKIVEDLFERYPGDPHLRTWLERLRQ